MSVRTTAAADVIPVPMSGADISNLEVSAVVDDAVDLTRGAKKHSAAGFVNAVLRSVLRSRHRLPLPERPGDPVERERALAYLGVTHSHPEWLAARWLARGVPAVACCS